MAASDLEGAQGNAEASKRREVAERGRASSLRQGGEGEGEGEKLGLGLETGRDGLAPGFLLDDYASLEAVELLVREAERRGVGAGYGAVAAAAAAAADGLAGGGGGIEDGCGVSSVMAAAAPPTTPLECLVGLIGQLADGGKVSVEHALAALNGNGNALGRLVSVFVLAVVLTRVERAACTWCQGMYKLARQA